MYIDDFLTMVDKNNNNIVITGEIADKIMDDLANMPKYKRLIYMSCFNHVKSDAYLNRMYSRFKETQYIEQSPFISLKYKTYIFFKSSDIYKNNMCVFDIYYALLMEKFPHHDRLRLDIDAILELIMHDENVLMDISISNLLGVQPNINIQDFI